MVSRVLVGGYLFLAFHWFNAHPKFLLYSGLWIWLSIFISTFDLTGKLTSLTA